MKVSWTRVLLGVAAGLFLLAVSKAVFGADFIIDVPEGRTDATHVTIYPFERPVRIDADRRFADSFE
jgi:hypothetical protein